LDNVFGVLIDGLSGKLEKEIEIANAKKRVVFNPTIIAGIVRKHKGGTRGKGCV